MMDSRFVSNESCIAELDIREDEDQFIKLQDIIDLIVAAGYFRARIKALHPFDMIVGGMVWCVTLCNVSVDVDLFYSENSTIGQKISLTETIVDVLSQLNCPHAIEPHQIQGLDFRHIYPVIQWLVKQAIEANDRYGHTLCNHAAYRFNKEFNVSRYFDDRPTSVDKLQVFKLNCLPKRVYRRVSDYACTNLMEDVHFTLKEYEWCSASRRSQHDRHIESNFVECKADTENLILDELQSNFSMELAKRLESSFSCSLADTADKIKCQVDELKIENENADNDLKRIRYQLKEIEAATVEIRAQLSIYAREVDGADEKLIKKLNHSLLEHDEIKKLEAEFKSSCKKEMQKLVDKLQLLRPGEESKFDETELHMLKSERKLLREKLLAVRHKMASINKKLVVEERRIDAVPSQLEITQYQRRIIELYNQVASKHQEMKRFYTLHNTLLDVKAFICREIDMLNNIEQVQDLSSKDNYKESFLENLEQISKGVCASYDKISMKQCDLQKERNQLFDEYKYMCVKEQTYHKTVDYFKKECQLNEELTMQLCKQDECTK